MGNTFFYRQVKDDSTKITWKDILSECRKKHTRQDLEYALSAGTVMNRVAEADMLGKWQKPWIFYPMLKGGLLLVILTYAALFVPIFAIGSYNDGSLYLTTILPPIVIPFILVIFIWELNIPKNISVYELLIGFLAGGILSFAVVSVMFLFVGDGPGIFAASFAAFREEPAKLAAAALILYLFSKNKKIYGLTGLVVGAAVGAGFGAFESVSYAINGLLEGGAMYSVMISVVRGIFALGGHTLYTAPYTAALALAAHRDGIKPGCFLNRDFLLFFFGSMALHFCWNADVGGFPKYIAITVILWVELLYIVKKCLYQAIDIGQRAGGSLSSGAAVSRPALSQKAGTIQIAAVAGVLRGAIWRSDGSEILRMGRGEGNQFRFPADAGGVSRNHCSVRMTSQGWVVRDEGSAYGTYINQGEKLAPGLDRVLHPGDVIYLGGKEQAFRVML